MKLPTTVEEILATAEIDPEFDQALKEKPLPSFPGLNIEDLKAMVNAGLPSTQKALADSRPEDIQETTLNITMRDGYENRAIITKPSAPPGQICPLIVLYHGGGHCFGYPEMELKLARRLVQELSAICILPSYRLAPEYPFSCSFEDSWDALQCIAKESSSASMILPHANASLGFIIGGISAGGAITSSLAHLARDHNLNPPLTGQMNSIGSVMHADHVPQKYQARYLSREQNKEAPILNEKFHLLMRNARKPDPMSSSIQLRPTPTPDRGRQRQGRPYGLATGVLLMLWLGYESG